MNDRIHQYELLDFGDGRKLERFGEVVVDRPCPAAEGASEDRSRLVARGCDGEISMGAGR